ncbi:MAG TPA: Fe-S cluster assembly protein SufD [Candidatus Binatia bacterium]|nr:Fe-S cluster assembly protein SufD [Candidatus Binatia bacterium]
MNPFEDAFAALPEPARRGRESHLRRFLGEGLPDRGVEEWKYTDLSGLAARRFAHAGTGQPEPVMLAGARRLAFANGVRVDGDVSLVQPCDPRAGGGAVAALNAAFAHQGLNLLVEGSAAPLLLDTWFGGGDEQMAHLRHRVHLRPHAEATLVLLERGDDAAFFATQMLELRLEAGARLCVYRIQRPGARTTLLTRLDADVGPDARLEVVSLHAGGMLSRCDVHVELARGAQADVAGVLAPCGREHLDVHTRVDHREPHGTSRERFRVVAREQSRAVFNGKVVVHAGAQKTDSRQEVASLLLSPQAEVDAKPELEIYADDVKCSHGATCGQLDEAQVFYLRSRGVPESAARNLLLYAFAHERLTQIAFEPARRLAEETLLERLPGAPRREELQ